MDGRVNDSSYVQLSNHVSLENITWLNRIKRLIFYIICPTYIDNDHSQRMFLDVHFALGTWIRESRKEDNHA